MAARKKIGLLPCASTKATAIVQSAENTAELLEEIKQLRAALFIYREIVRRTTRLSEAA